MIGTDGERERESGKSVPSVLIMIIIGSYGIVLRCY